MASSDGCQAFVDTGSPLLVSPSEPVSNIQRRINPRPNQDDQVKGHATG